MATSTMRVLRRYSPSVYGPVPTGCAPMSVPYASTTSRACADIVGTASTYGKRKSGAVSLIRSV